MLFQLPEDNNGTLNYVETDDVVWIEVGEGVAEDEWQLIVVLKNPEAEKQVRGLTQQAAKDAAVRLAKVKNQEKDA